MNNDQCSIEEASPAAETDNVLGMCTVPGCTGDALRTGVCKRHLLKLAMGGDPEAAEAVRQWHAVHDVQPETPRVPTWRKYPENEGGPVPKGRRKGRSRRDACGKGGSAEPGRRNSKLNADPQGSCGSTAENAEEDHAAEDGEEQEHPRDQEPSTPQGYDAPRENTTMKKTDKVRCGKCGREYLANGISRHFVNCKGPGAGKGGRRKAEGGSQIAEETAAALPPSDFRLPPSSPSRGIAPVCHSLARVVELLGLDTTIGDCRHPDGHLFINTASGQAVIVAPNGDVVAAGPVLGWSKP